jgi:outer membrane protein TolC
MFYDFRLKGFFVAVILTCAVIAAGFAYAVDGLKEKETEVLKLSLADAIKMAENNNPQIHLSKLALEKANLAKKEIVYKDKNTPDMVKNDFDVKYGFELGKKRADFGVKMAEVGVDATIRNIRFGVEAAYYAALAADDNYRIAEESLKMQEEMLRIAQAKFKSGTVARKDVLDAQTQLAKAQADYQKAESEKEKAYINLKRLLGIEMDRPVELTDEFEYRPLDKEADLKKLLEDAQKNRMDIIQARWNLDIAQLDFDLISKVYPSNTFKYKEKEYNLEEARIKFDDTVSQVEAEVREILLDLRVAGGNIPLLDKSVEAAEESLRLAKLSYEAGIVRSVDVMAAEEALKRIRLQRSQAIYNYNLAKIKLENVVYIPVSGSAATGSSTMSGSLNSAAVSPDAGGF